MKNETYKLLLEAVRTENGHLTEVEKDELVWDIYEVMTSKKEVSHDRQK